MATTAACACASSGSISGSGLASANTTAPGFMVATSAPVSTLGADTPMNTSAPAMASLIAPVMPVLLVASATADRFGSMPGRSQCTMPAMSQAMMSDGFCSNNNRMIALPAAPTPDTTIRQSVMSLPTTRSALRSAATTTIAVPC